VPTGERVLHHIVGVGIFGWLLDLAGWNYLIEPLGDSRAKGPAYYPWNSLREPPPSPTESALPVLALFSRHPWSAALWMLLAGVVVHLYPVLLQRSIMFRLQPLLDNMAPADWVGH
jgi:hypothetical protein